MTDIPSNPKEKVVPFPQFPWRAHGASVDISDRATVVLRPAFGTHQRVDDSGEQGDTPSFAMDPERLLSGLGFGDDSIVEIQWTSRLAHLHSIIELIPTIQAGRLANPHGVRTFEYQLVIGFMSDEQIASAILSATEDELYRHGAYYAPLAEELLWRVINDRISAL